MQWLMDLAKAHPLTAIMVALAFVANAWKLLPSAMRKDVEARFPRIVGAIRVIYEIAPNLVDAAHAARTQVLRGVPKDPTHRPSVVPPPLPSDTSGVSQ